MEAFAPPMRAWSKPERALPAIHGGHCGLSCPQCSGRLGGRTAAAGQTRIKSPLQTMKGSFAGAFRVFLSAGHRRKNTYCRRRVRIFLPERDDVTHRTADAVCHMNPHRFGGFRGISALNGAIDAAVLFENGNNLKCLLILKPENVIPELLVGPLDRRYPLPETYGNGIPGQAGTSGRCRCCPRSSPSPAGR